MRRKINLAYINNDSLRRASFKKRSIGLMKKVRELTILCDVSACVMIYGPGEYGPVTVWPNEDEARHLVQRFRRIPEMERRKKMVTQESYLSEQATKMSQQIQRLIRKNRETVLGLVMRKISAGRPLDELGDLELRGVMSMLEEKMGEIDRRIARVENPGGVYLPPPHAEETAETGDFLQYRDFLGGFRDFGNGNVNHVNMVEYEGIFNQEIVSNYTSMNVENMRLGFTQHVDYVNMLNSLNAGYNGGVQGFGNLGENNVKAGNDIEEVGMGYETGKMVEPDDTDEVPYDLVKHWPTFISPSL